MTKNEAYVKGLKPLDMGSTLGQSTKKRLNKVCKRAWKAGLRYRRLIGYGGHGLAALFETVNADNTLTDYAVKAAFPGHIGILKDETKTMKVSLGYREVSLY